MSLKAVVEIIALAAILSLESFFPLFPKRPGRLRHALCNLSLGLLNVVVVSLVFSALLAAETHWVALHRWGLLPGIGLGGVSAWAASFLLLDLWMYVFHRMNHRLPFFWRFHRTHHSDNQVDVTSALRFHTGEIVISSLFRMILVPLFGFTLAQILFYEIGLQPVILFHHSNVAFPEKWDARMRWILVSPNMHRVHHSQLRVETDSNYASIFSFWDRIGQTFRQREDPSTLVYGLPEFPNGSWQTLLGMLKTPLAPLTETPSRGTRPASQD